MRNTKVILARNINLDNSYSNVLNYTEEQMLNLLRDENNLVYENDTYSFIRENENQINVKASYQTCLGANYLAFQNTNYGGKWFFAFITDVKYNAEASTIVTFEVDVFSTWFNNLTVKPCFIEREHVNDDTAGKHTIPEGLETGDYIGTVGGYLESADDDDYIIFQVVTQPTGDPTAGDYSGPNTQYGAIYSGTEFRIFDVTNAGRFIRYMDEIGKKDYIVNIFMYSGVIEDDGLVYTITNHGVIVCEYSLVKTGTSALWEQDIDVYGSKPSSLGAYTPKNKKLLTYPYTYFIVNNNGGTTKVYKWEDFEIIDPTESAIKFSRVSTPAVGGSVMFYPWNYKTGTNYASELNYTEGFVGAKFPTCSWSSDGYINWLTQTAVNREDTFKKDVGGTILGAGMTVLGLTTGFAPLTMMGATAVASGVADTIGDIKENVKAKEQHQIAPMELNGNASAGDVMYAFTRCKPRATILHIKEEYARIIDDFFSRFGYQVNIVKTPNITGRRYWNYVKIGSGEDIGNGTIPNKYKDGLNRIFRSGTTIWHSHENIGNFNLTNDII